MRNRSFRSHLGHLFQEGSFCSAEPDGVVQLDTLKYKPSGSIINACHCYCGMKWKRGLSLGPPKSASAGPGPSHGWL